MKKKKSSFLNKILNKIKAPLNAFQQTDYQPLYKRLEFLNLKKEFLSLKDDSGDEIVLTPQKTVRVSFSGNKARPEMELWRLLTGMNDQEIAELSPIDQQWRSDFIHVRMQHYSFQEIAKWKDPSYKPPSIHEGIQMGLQWKLNRDPDFFYKLLTIHGVEEMTRRNNALLETEIDPQRREFLLKELEKLEARGKELSVSPSFNKRIISSPTTDQVNPEELTQLISLSKELKVPFEEKESLSFSQTQKSSSYQIPWVSVNNDGLVVSISLNGKSLIQFPDSLFLFPKLKKLNVANNQLTVLPESVGELANLEILDLSHNQLVTLPDSFGNLSKLKDLRLHNNLIEFLPASISQLGCLSDLNLASNQLTILPESVTQLIPLTSLSLQDNHLTTLPEAIGDLVNLNDLALGKNQISELPESIGQLTKLTELKLWENQLTSLPNSLAQLTRVRSVVLSNNLFSQLPRILGKMPSLQTIELNNNPDLGDKSRFFTITSYQKHLSMEEMD